MSDRHYQDARQGVGPRVHTLTPRARPAPTALAHLAKAAWEAEVDTEVDRAASAL